MESHKTENKDASRQRLQELQREYNAQQESPAPEITKEKDAPPTVTPPPEMSNLNYRSLKQYISEGEAATITVQRNGAGPWQEKPTFQHTFQSSKPNVRVTVTPRQGKAIEYIYRNDPTNQSQQILVEPSPAM